MEENCFSEEITGTKVTNPKTVQGEDVEFRDIVIIITSMIFNDTYQIIRPMVSSWEIKT
jgi:hypothetical protein